jgi:hypothetical protein
MRSRFGNVLLGIAITLPLMMVVPAIGVDSNFSGTWNLNIKRSRFNPGPGPKTSTYIIEADESGVTALIIGEASDSTSISCSFTAKFDGKDYPVIGGCMDTIAIRKMDANTHSIVMRKGGKLHGRGRATVSGNTLILTSIGTDAAGRRFKNTAVYDRQ